MAKVSKNSLAALTSSSERTHKATREALELAFARLRHGNPKVVSKGCAITPTAVAREAGVRRETLYRFHEPVLTQIRTHGRKQPMDRLRQSQVELGQEKASSQALRVLVEQAQQAEEALARINHRLTAQLAEMEQKLLLREQTIRELRDQIASYSKVRALSLSRERK